VLKLADLSHEQISKTSDGCNDTQPMWIGETVYFLSDRGGEFNLYSYDLKSKNVVRRTRHESFPVESASADAGRIIYEQAAYLHLFNPGTNDSGDLERVIRAMLSELAVGHSYLGGGERLCEPEVVLVGLLGADYEVAEGRFRFKTIYEGAYWDPGLRAPLSAPGVDVRPGDFLLAVDDKAIAPDAEVHRAFEGTVGERVQLKVGPRADGSRCESGPVQTFAPGKRR